MRLLDHTALNAASSVIAPASMSDVVSTGNNEMIAAASAAGSGLDFLGYTLCFVPGDSLTDETIRRWNQLVRAGNGAVSDRPDCSTTHIVTSLSSVRLAAWLRSVQSSLDDLRDTFLISSDWLVAAELENKLAFPAQFVLYGFRQLQQDYQVSPV